MLLKNIDRLLRKKNLLSISSIIFLCMAYQWLITWPVCHVSAAKTYRATARVLMTAVDSCASLTGILPELFGHFPVWVSYHGR